MARGYRRVTFEDSPRSPLFKDHRPTVLPLRLPLSTHLRNARHRGPPRSAGAARAASSRLETGFLFSVDSLAKGAVITLPIDSDRGRMTALVVRRSHPGGTARAGQGQGRPASGAAAAGDCGCAVRHDEEAADRQGVERQALRCVSRLARGLDRASMRNRTPRRSMPVNRPNSGGT